jgi:hypothetical protein
MDPLGTMREGNPFRAYHKRSQPEGTAISGDLTITSSVPAVVGVEAIFSPTPPKTQNLLLVLSSYFNRLILDYEDVSYALLQ